MTEQSMEEQAKKLMIAQARKNKVLNEVFSDYGFALELAKRVIQAEQERDQARAEVTKARKDALEEVKDHFLKSVYESGWNIAGILNEIQALAAKDAQEGE